MHILQAVLLGIVEGVTEFLPISSTGHQIIVEAFLHIKETDFVKTFTIVIQFGAILAVVLLYWRSFLNRIVLQKVVVAFIPTGIIGFLLYKVIKNTLLGSNAIVLWSLLIGGVVIILFELFHTEKGSIEDVAHAISYKQAAAIGVMQALAVVPGVSRAAATIIGGMAMGIRRKPMVEFSFLLAVPTMVAASGYDLLKSSPSFSGNDMIVLLIGTAVACVVAIVSIRWLLRFVRTNTFLSFGVYRVAVAVVLLLFGIAR